MSSRKTDPYSLWIYLLNSCKIQANLGGTPKKTKKYNLPFKERSFQIKSKLDSTKKSWN